MEHYSVDINRRRAGVVIDSSLPHLMALEDDVLSTGVVLYHLKVRTLVYPFLPKPWPQRSRREKLGVAVMFLWIEIKTDATELPSGLFSGNWST